MGNTLNNKPTRHASTHQRIMIWRYDRQRPAGVEGVKRSGNVLKSLYFHHPTKKQKWISDIYHPGKTGFADSGTQKRVLPASLRS